MSCIVIHLSLIQDQLAEDMVDGYARTEQLRALNLPERGTTFVGGPGEAKPNA